MQGEITASSRADPDLRPLVVMCPTRIQPKLLPIELDLSKAFFFEHGFGQAELLQLGPQLQRAWQMVLEALPVEAGSPFSQPQRLLREYHAERRQSMLGRILSRAKQLRETVDRVVILGPPPLIAAAQAVFAACGHPHHNDLSRGQRGGRPRIYFLPTAPDNDAIQGLLEILPQRKLLSTVDDRWGVLALESNEADRAHRDNGGLLTGLFIVLWDILQATSTAANETELAAFVGPMNSSLMTLAAQIGLPRIGIDNSTPASQFASSAFFHPGVLCAARSWESTLLNYSREPRQCRIASRIHRRETIHRSISQGCSICSLGVMRITDSASIRQRLRWRRWRETCSTLAATTIYWFNGFRSPFATIG